MNSSLKQTIERLAIDADIRDLAARFFDAVNRRDFNDLQGIEPIDRSFTNSFESEAFRDAEVATGRRRLIFGALQTEVCLTCIGR